MSEENDNVNERLASFLRGTVRKFSIPEKPSGVDGVHCPKCGWEGKSVGEWKEYCFVPAEQSIAFGFHDGEFLLVSCGRCKYRWKEPTLGND